MILLNFKIFTFAHFYDRDLHKERKFGYGNSLGLKFSILWRIYLSDKHQHCNLELHDRVLHNHYLVSINVIEYIVNIFLDQLSALKSYIRLTQFKNCSHKPWSLQTLRRSCLPPPQETEHSLHAAQSVHPFLEVFFICKIKLIEGRFLFRNTKKSLFVIFFKN